VWLYKPNIWKVGELGWHSLNSIQCSRHVHATFMTLSRLFVAGVSVTDKGRDLLADKSKYRLEVKQGAQGSHMPGLTEVRVEGVNRAWSYLKTGQRNRMSAAISMNTSSSRSQHPLLRAPQLLLTYSPGRPCEGSI
jgi:hypothetical protein